MHLLGEASNSILNPGIRIFSGNHQTPRGTAGFWKSKMVEKNGESIPCLCCSVDLTWSTWHRKRTLNVQKKEPPNSCHADTMNIGSCENKQGGGPNSTGRVSNSFGVGYGKHQPTHSIVSYYLFFPKTGAGFYLTRMLISLQNLQFNRTDRSPNKGSCTLGVVPHKREIRIATTGQTRSNSTQGLLTRAHSPE